MGTVDVLFTDNVAIDPASPTFGDVTVTGPNGFGETSHIYIPTLLSGSAALAQTGTGVIAGTVTDASSSTAVANAQVRVVNAVGVETIVAAGTDGSYRVAGLAPGAYLVSARAIGYRQSPAIRLEGSGGSNGRNWEASLLAARFTDDGAGDGPGVRVSPTGQVQRRSAIESEGQGHEEQGIVSASEQ